jgi:hypothetical protein
MKSFYNRITGRAAQLTRKYHFVLAGAMLLVMGGLAYGSMVGNSAIVDEVAHIPAAYAYLHYGDYRLNPEHPPLIKDLAAIPLQFLHLTFPDTVPAWTTDVNGQWEAGWNFLYHIGNNADEILYWARLPILILGLAFGVALYWIVRRHFGTAVALMALFFYCFSPNFIGHTTLVTTDVGASAFMFLALVAFARYVNRPNKVNLAILALGLAGAQLAKFSSALLYPLLGVMALIAAGVMLRPAKLGERFKVFIGGTVLASLISLLIIWAYYVTQVWRMPASVQDELIRGSVNNDRIRVFADLLLGMNHVAVFKPLAQYLLGLVMVYGRVTGGNVTYFNGQAVSGSFHSFFPELFMVKTQVALLVLLFVAVGSFIWRVHRNRVATWNKRLTNHLRSHMFEWTLGFFAAFYFFVAVAGNLNLGIRHIMPIYIPLFVLVALATVKALRRVKRLQRRQFATAGVAVLLVWYGLSTALAYPNYISYFNEFVGGGANADKYFSDSNVDWGQDLLRFKKYVAAHPEIKHIALDYFGGAVPDYYFCPRAHDAAGQIIKTAQGYDCSQSVYSEWHTQNGRYTGQYIAVSETFLENDRYYAQLYNQEGYGYLRERTPIAKVGNSIYVFKLY